MRAGGKHTLTLIVFPLFLLGSNSNTLGTILTTLNLTNRTRANIGYILWLDKRTLEQIHNLFRNYGASLEWKTFENCEFCDSVSETHTKLRRKGKGHAARRVA